MAFPDCFGPHFIFWIPIKYIGHRISHSSKEEFSAPYSKIWYLIFLVHFPQTQCSETSGCLMNMNQLIDSSHLGAEVF